MLGPFIESVFRDSAQSFAGSRFEPSDPVPKNVARSVPVSKPWASKCMVWVVCRAPSSTPP